MATGKRGKRCRQRWARSCVAADTPLLARRLRGGQEDVVGVRSTGRSWAETRLSPWCLLSPVTSQQLCAESVRGQEDTALLGGWMAPRWDGDNGRSGGCGFNHVSPGHLQCCPLTKSLPKGARLGRRRDLRPLRTAQNPVPYRAALALVSYSVCPPSKTPHTNPLSPNQPSVPQKAASAKPPASHPLVDINTFTFTY